MCTSRHAIRPRGLAEILSDIGGKPVPFKTASDQDHIAHLMAAGLSAPAAGVVLTWVNHINAGKWNGQSGDLEKLLDRGALPVHLEKDAARDFQPLAGEPASVA